MASIEEKVEEYYKKVLDDLGIRHFAKTESINDAIDSALKESNSKSGNSGNNYPDIKLLLDNNQGRRVPVMIEAKGSKGSLEKLSKDGSVIGVTHFDKDGTISKITGQTTHKKGDADYSAIMKYAVNGALHYGNAILNNNGYDEVIVIGVNGYEIDKNGTVKKPECKAYYVSIKNNKVPKHIKELDNDLVLLKSSNLKKLYSILDNINLSDEEREELTKKTENELEEKIKSIHQTIYEGKIKSMDTNSKLFIFCGLIMAGLETEGVKPLEVLDLPSNDNDINNDGIEILKHIETYLHMKKMGNDKIQLVLNLITPVFKRNELWEPRNGESYLKEFYREVKNDIIPLMQSNFHLDFTGKILNSLNDWVHIDNDRAHDVVLTPRYVTNFMAKLAQVNKDSFVWDSAMGSAGFLVSALDIMISDAKNKIKDEKALEEKIENIKKRQLLGIEIKGNIYLLAILNMILMGDGSSNIIQRDSHEYELDNNFPANVFLLNPPYSSPGKGLDFVEEAFDKMRINKGYGCILIQENAGANMGQPYSKNILRNNTLIASIHMPNKLFIGKASVQTAIYLFKVGRPHEENDIVTFIDFSNDGYQRLGKSKSTAKVNLKDVDHVKERYKEIEDIILNKDRKTTYYTEDNGLVIKDTISLEGNDWTFNQHKKIDIIPNEKDFKQAIGDYLEWEIKNVIMEI